MVHMPRPRFQTLPADRRSAILDAAGQHFAALGYAGASLNRILDAAGLSKGVAYYYFDDKADLFATAVEAAFSGLPDALDPAALDRETFWPTLEALYLAQWTTLSARPWTSRLVRAVPAAFEDPDAGPGLRARLEPLAAPLLALQDRARALGLVRTDLPEALVWAMLRGLDDAIDTWISVHPKADATVARRAFAALRAIVTGP